MASLAVWAGLRRRRVVDQQLWFLGRDIGAAGGNALLRFGFERRRPNTGTGSSLYALPTDSGAAHVVCWGFGLYLGVVACADPLAQSSPAAMPWAGLVLTRFDGAPRLIADPLPLDVHQVTDLPPLLRIRCAASRAYAAAQLRALAAHLATYEQWAITTLGPCHRAAAVRDAPRHKRRCFHDLPELSSVWQQLCAPALTGATSATPRLTG